MEEGTPQATEVELKLRVAPADVPRLRRHPRVRSLATGRARTATLHSVYWDTPRLDLLREGIVLRVRRTGRSRVQTVKTTDAGRAGLFARGEWESAVPGDRPHLAAIPDAAVRTRVAEAAAGGGLEPVVETEVRRTRRLLRGADFEAHFDLDQGEVRTAAGALPISELELELVRGGAAALYGLALELAEGLDLRPASEGKAEAGFALLTGRGPAPVRARRPALQPASSLDDAIAEILASGLEQVAANEAPARAGVDPEGVHQLRVGVRRLRSAFGLFRDVLPAGPVTLLTDELRWLGRALGPARDLDVFLAEVLGPVSARFADDPALKRLREVAEALREEAYLGVRETLDDPRFGRLLLRLGAFVAGRGWRDQPLTPESARLFAPARETADALLARRHRKCRRLGRDLARRTPAERHELRIQLKKLRYAAEFFGGLHPDRRPRRMARRLARLQDVLGGYNDRRVAEMLLDRILERLGPEASDVHQRAAGFVAGWIARTGLAAEDELAQRYQRFAGLRPFWEA